MNNKGVFYIIVGLIFLHLFYNLGYLDLTDWDESLYSEVAKQMYLSGNWIDPKINGHTFVEKPPFSIWLQAISYSIFGINEFSARFPSAFGGLLFAILFYLSGKKLVSKKFGLLWALIYVTAIIPSFITRSALTDNIFNLFITLAIFFLFFYEQKRSQNALLDKTNRDFKFQYIYLFLTGIFIGCAVLSKGPVGGAIPVISYLIYKCFYRKPIINLIDFTLLGLLSSLVGFSWYFLFTLKYGDNFVQGFFDFHLNLFSDPLLYQGGPFYYHFILMFFGFLPWTAFLFNFKKTIILNSGLLKSAALFALIWVVFVLSFTAIIATKLPHYSATIYIPYSFFCALIINQILLKKLQFKRSVKIILIIQTLFLLSLFFFIPYLFKQLATFKNITYEFSYLDSQFLCYLALGLLLLIFQIYALLKDKIIVLVLSLAITSFFVVQTLTTHFIPIFLEYNQRPLVRFIQKLPQGSLIAQFRMVSFATLFYGVDNNEMLYSKFPGDHLYLKRKHDKDVFIMLHKSDTTSFLKEYPNSIHLYDESFYTFYRLPPQKN